MKEAAPTLRFRRARRQFTDERSPGAVRPPSSREPPSAGSFVNLSTEADQAQVRCSFDYGEGGFQERTKGPVAQTMSRLADVLQWRPGRLCSRAALHHSPQATTSSLTLTAVAKKASYVRLGVADVLGRRMLPLSNHNSLLCEFRGARAFLG